MNCGIHTYQILDSQGVCPICEGLKTQLPSIEEGLQEISEGKVVPLNQLEKPEEQDKSLLTPEEMKLEAIATVIELLPIDNPTPPESVLWGFVEKAVKLQALTSFKAGYEAQLAKVQKSRPDREKLRRKIFELLQDEPFEDACLYNSDSRSPCYQWNQSAQYCMRKSIEKCPKVNQIIELLEGKE